MEDKEGVGRVKAICKAYEGALRSSREFEENRVRVLKKVSVESSGADGEDEKAHEGGREKEEKKENWKKRDGMRAHA